MWRRPSIPEIFDCPMEKLVFEAVSQMIQLAVAPAFLLVAVGSFLSVGTMRLGRVVDRARVLEVYVGDRHDEKNEASYRDELKALEGRMRAINMSIMFVTFAALIICCIIAVLFVSALLSVNSAIPLTVMFVVTTILLIIGFIFFLKEIFIATKTIRVHTEYFEE